MGIKGFPATTLGFGTDYGLCACNGYSATCNISLVIKGVIVRRWDYTNLIAGCAGSRRMQIWVTSNPLVVGMNTVEVLSMEHGQANSKRVGIAMEAQLRASCHLRSRVSGVLKCEEINIPLKFGRDSRWI